ncbi:MAG: hypothetical protein HND57_11210, partial [Planctomycetes bacterium]|nr:hypothetical protein [Planctomycetota bacterium]
MKPNALIPSMFHRRLALLTTLCAVVMCVLVAQLYHLTVAEGARLRANAERVLVDRQLLPTRRGSVYDRNGLELAVDNRCFDFLVDYRLITGAWVAQQAGSEARRRYRDVWDTLSRSEREDRREECRPPYEQQLEAFWQQLAYVSAISRDEMEDRKQEIVDRVERMAQYLWERWKEEREAELQVSLTLDDVAQPIREQRIPHAILSGIEIARETDFRRLAATAPRISSSLPGATIQAGGRRVNPWNDVDVEMPRDSLPSPLRSESPIYVHLQDTTSPIVGSVRDQVYADELKARPLIDPVTGTIVDRGGYTVDDEIGSTGIEQQYEHHLRGVRGVMIEHFDTGDIERQPPSPGADVTLSLDVRLQARVQAILSPQYGLTVVQPWHGTENQLPIGTPLDAAAVVIDVASSHVLALVSGMNEFPADTLDPEVDSALARTLDPSWVNLACQKPVAPGSIVKPLMLASAITEGRWAADQVVECNGHYFPADPEHYRCWIYRDWFGFATHGPLGPVEAVGRSCNMYFYTVGHALGAQRQRDWYLKWGLGRAFSHLGPATVPGMIGDPAEANIGEVLRRGIGQGLIGWTPLHAAAAYAALGRGGLYLEPILVLDPDAPAPFDENATPSRDDEPTAENLGLNQHAVSLALDGLDQVVNNQQYGGARQIDMDPDPDVRQYEPIFNAEQVKVWGKTGTAQQNWPTVLVEYNPVTHEPILDAHGRPRTIERASGIGALVV